MVVPRMTHRRVPLGPGRDSHLSSNAQPIVIARVSCLTPSGSHNRNCAAQNSPQLHDATQFSLVRCNTVRNCTMQHSPQLHSPQLHDVTQSSTVQSSTVRCNTVLNCTVLNCTMQHSSQLYNPPLYDATQSSPAQCSEDCVASCSRGLCCIVKFRTVQFRIGVV
jgi:hypothetical protein